MSWFSVGWRLSVMGLVFVSFLCGVLGAQSPTPEANRNEITRLDERSRAVAGEITRLTSEIERINDQMFWFTGSLALNFIVTGGVAYDRARYRRANGVISAHK